MRATTHHAVLLIMSALFVLVAYLDELVDRPLESFEYSVVNIYSGHLDLTSTVATSSFP